MDSYRGGGPRRIEHLGDDRRLSLGDGRVLGFREYGDPQGVPILCFHGTPGSRLMFQIAEQFAQEKGLRLIAPERPGYGLSSFVKARALSDTGRDMAALCDALGLERVACAGVSGGAPFALAFATTHPRRVSALGLVSPVGPVAGPERPERIGPGHALTFRLLPGVPLLYRVFFSIGRAGFVFTPQLMAAFLMARAAPSDWHILSDKRARRGLFRGLREGVRRGIGGAVEEMRCFSRPWQVAFENIRAPVILWQGMADRNIPVSAAVKLGECVPGCEIRRLEGAGHFWILRNYHHVLDGIANLAREAA